MANEIFKCKICGGQAKWDPEVQKVKCMFCDTEFELNEFETTPQTENFEVGRDAQELGYVEATDDSSNVRPEDLRVYKCSYCGAEIVTDKTTAATNCVFCNNPVVIEEQLATEFKPKWVIPFKINPRDVEDMYLKYIKKPFTPDSFLSREHIQKIKGVYVPFWLCDCEMEGTAKYKGANVKSWRQGDYDITETTYFNVLREGKLGFEMIPVDASTKMPDEHMDAIEPFNYKDLKPFSTAYLPGFLANKYDVSQEESMARISERAKNSIRTEMRNTVRGYAMVNTENESYNFNSKSVKYALLPVWMLSTKYKGENFLFAMNGQTGKLIGDLPVDKKKFWGLFAAIAAPLAIMFSTLAYMKVYASYFKIKEVMIDPYYEEHPEERPETYEDEEIIMRDDVTERERLEEIKRRTNIID